MNRKEKEEFNSELEKENATLKANLFDLNVKIKNMIQELDTSRREIDHQGVEFKKQSDLLKLETKYVFFFFSIFTHNL